MMSVDQVNEAVRLTESKISELKTVKEHLIESGEYPLARSTEETIRRYQRDVKILEKVLKG